MFLEGVSESLATGWPLQRTILMTICSGVVAEIIGQISADAKGQLAAPAELLVQLDGARNGQAIAEDQGFGARVDPVAQVVVDHALAPCEWVAAVVARAVEQLAEKHVEVAQEGVHAIHIAERNAQVAAVLLGPGLEGKYLAVPQARAQSLRGLQVFVGHGAQWREPQLHGEQYIAGTRQLTGRPPHCRGFAGCPAWR